MSYILNGTTLKRPQRFQRIPIEVSADVLTISGSTKRDITGRKYQYTLSYQNINVTDATTIQTIYDLQTVVQFQSTETNNTIAAVDVLVDLSTKSFSTPGTDYLSRLDLILTEVDV